MDKIKIILALILYISTIKGEDMNKHLTNFQRGILFNKKTESPFSGKYNNFYEDGIYTCANCGSALYRSTDKFNSSCGWPSFDDEIEGRIKKVPDSDGVRIEIVCNNCNGHLGHIFNGENLTDKNIRHCVNSASMNFIKNSEISNAYFGGGCFWGVEYYLEQLDGVLFVESGYMGGIIPNPSYKNICTGITGYKEIVKVYYDSNKISYKEIAKRFFEIHDPTQINGQGPDIGKQYLSIVFYKNNREKKIIENLISILKQKGYKVVTKLKKKEKFWRAENYHQNYYYKKGTTPYCHTPVDRFK